MTAIRVKFTVFRVIDMNIDKPDACSGGKTLLEVGVRVVVVEVIGVGVGLG